MTLYQRTSVDTSVQYTYGYPQPYMISIVGEDVKGSLLDTNNWSLLPLWSVDSTFEVDGNWVNSEFTTSYQITELNALYCLAKEF